MHLMNQPKPATFAASQIPSLLRALADPEGKGEISPECGAAIQQIEKNLARHRKACRPAPTNATAANRVTSASQVG